MTAAEWNWYLTIAGTAASGLGLLFSILAWVQAKGARKAADEASRAAKSRETAYEFAALAADSKDLLSAVQGQRSERAVEATNDLVHQLTVCLSRRRDFLPCEDQLRESVKQLDAVSNFLSSRGFPTEPAEIAKLVRRCQQVHQVICTAQGILEKVVEGGKEQ